MKLQLLQKLHMKLPVINHSTGYIRMAAVGDLLLTTRPGATTPGRGLKALSNEVREIFESCDVIFANLESTMPGPRTVTTEPRVVASEIQVRSLQDAQIDVVSLGNNHAFDCLEEGFHRMRSILDDLGINWFGAGDNLKEALRPAIMEVKGIKLAFVASVDKTSAPSHFADKTQMGVAPSGPQQICQVIQELRSQVDHVIVSPHWGEERFRIPSPEQIRKAHAFVDTGASMVLGHHPHVLQGMELYKGAPIAYSLGNFLANYVYWEDGDFLNWDRAGRTGCILLLKIDAQRIHSCRQILTFDDGATICLDKSRRGRRYLRKVNEMLASGITPKKYQRETFRVRKLWPIYSHLRWSELHRIRPAHFRKALRHIFGIGNH